MAAIEPPPYPVYRAAPPHDGAAAVGPDSAHARLEELNWL
jgi:hypothetical protein